MNGTRVVEELKECSHGGRRRAQALLRVRTTGAVPARQSPTCYASSLGRSEGGVRQAGATQALLWNRPSASKGSCSRLGLMDVAQGATGAPHAVPPLDQVPPVAFGPACGPQLAQQDVCAPSESSPPPASAPRRKCARALALSNCFGLQRRGGQGCASRLQANKLGRLRLQICYRHAARPPPAQGAAPASRRWRALQGRTRRLVGSTAPCRRVLPGPCRQCCRCCSREVWKAGQRRRCRPRVATCRPLRAPGDECTGCGDPHEWRENWLQRPGAAMCSGAAARGRRQAASRAHQRAAHLVAVRPPLLDVGSLSAPGGVWRGLGKRGSSRIVPHSLIGRVHTPQGRVRLGGRARADLRWQNSGVLHLAWPAGCMRSCVDMRNERRHTARSLERAPPSLSCRGQLPSLSLLWRGRQSQHRRLWSPLAAACCDSYSSWGCPLERAAWSRAVAHSNGGCGGQAKGWRRRGSTSGLCFHLQSIALNFTTSSRHSKAVTRAQRPPSRGLSLALRPPWPGRRWNPDAP